MIQCRNWIEEIYKKLINTNNLKNRIEKHNSSKGAKFTRGKKWKILFKRRFLYKNDAMKYEYLLKKDRLKRSKIKQKYLSTIFGIIYCWKKFLKDERVCYLNYLPLWNFLIFIFLPPKTILGPITGGALYNKSNKINYLIRKMFFPIFYKFSELALILRFKNELIFLSFIFCILFKSLIIFL